MSGQDDYLWDRGGKIDPDLARLEDLLGRAGQSDPPPPLNFAVNIPPQRGLIVPVMLLVAASVVALIGLTWWTVQHPAAGFAVTRTAGTPRLGSVDMTAAKSDGELRIGGWLETPGDARALVEIANIGEVDVEPGSRIGLVSTTAGDYRLRLTRGTMHALIWAPPGQFSVDTPSATAIDLGCAYTLTVGDDGDGMVRVTSGWVGFEFNGRESFIPSGAVCRTRRGLGPGTPHYTDTSENFRASLDVVDFGDPSLAGRALDVVLAEATVRDAVTLWHLLTRVGGVDRDRVFTRLAALVPPP